MGLISKFIKLNGLVFVGGSALTIYSYPELRTQPDQLAKAMYRGMRCLKAGSMMAYDYYYAKEINSEVHLKAAKRMYDCFSKNAGPYIKLGQMVGQMRLLLPEEYCDTFEPLCMQAPRTKYEDIKSIVESEFGRPLEEIFEYFEKEPLASASLAQVHKAKIRGTGEIVAVKVQHKWIKEQVPGDLSLIQLATDIAAFIFPDFKYGWLPEEFKVRLPNELDFKKEAINCDKCRGIFAKNPNVQVPLVYHHLTKDRVLTMSFEEGISVAHVKEMYDRGIDLKKLSQLISESFTYMIFEKGFVHSDPHPGNMYVRMKKDAKSGSDIELVLLDHGLYTDLTVETRLSYTKLWRGILSQDERMIKESAKELGADFYELFTAMIVNRTFDDVMNKDKQILTKSRLGNAQTTSEKDALKTYALYYHKDIVEILDAIKRELLLVLKTNSYLRSIDSKLGNPNNSFNVINDITWKVFNSDIKQNLPRWVFYREYFRYYWLKFWLTMYRFKIRFMQSLGYKASEDELQDFEMESH